MGRYMTKSEFLDFYNCVIKELGERFEKDYTKFTFCDNAASVYEEYLNQKTMMKILYNKSEDIFLDRHKVCACMVVAIIKVRLLSCNMENDDGYALANASRVNEQLAFMSGWELFKGFIALHVEKEEKKYNLPDTFHNDSFLDTITRSLFFANQLNSLSTPLIANIFFLLEKYSDLQNEIKESKNEES